MFHQKASRRQTTSDWIDLQQVLHEMQNEEENLAGQTINLDFDTDNMTSQTAEAILEALVRLDDGDDSSVS